MAKKTARKVSPAVKGGKARTRKSAAKARRPDGRQARPDLATLVQHVDRAAQVTAWRIDQMEQQLANLGRMLVSLHQLYENRRVDAWRYNYMTAINYQGLQDSLSRAREQLAKEVAARRPGAPAQSG